MAKPKRNPRSKASKKMVLVRIISDLEKLDGWTDKADLIKCVAKYFDLHL